MTTATTLPKFDVLTGVNVVGDTITINTALPDRGAGYDSDDLRKWFKADLLAWALANGALIKGKVVRLNGASTVPMATFAGVLMNELDAERIEQSTITPGVWLTIAAHNDSEAPIPVRYKQGHVVTARVFGHEVHGVVIRAVDIGGKFQLCAMDNREQVWVAAADILRFERRLQNWEERKFVEIPRFYRPFNNLGVRTKDRVRFVLFEQECVGRVTAMRDSSCNIVQEGSAGGQTATLVPLDNVREIM